MKVKSLSRVRLLATPWTAAHQAPPSMGFSRQEYWSGLPLPSPCYALGVCNCFLLFKSEFFFFLRFVHLLFVFILAVLGLYCHALAFSSCGEQRLPFIEVCRFFIVVACLVAEHGL